MELLSRMCKLRNNSNRAKNKQTNKEKKIRENRTLTLANIISHYGVSHRHFESASLNMALSCPLSVRVGRHRQKNGREITHCHCHAQVVGSVWGQKRCHSSIMWSLGTGTLMYWLVWRGVGTSMYSVLCEEGVVVSMEWRRMWRGGGGRPVGKVLSQGTRCISM